MTSINLVPPSDLHTKDIVAGLELFAVKGTYGVYLQCDNCGATLDAARMNVGLPNERIGSDEHELLTRARLLGWSGPLTRGEVGDLCPGCSKKV